MNRSVPAKDVRILKMLQEFMFYADFVVWPMEMCQIELTIRPKLYYWLFSATGTEK